MYTPTSELLEVFCVVKTVRKTCQLIEWSLIETTVSEDVEWYKFTCVQLVNIVYMYTHFWMLLSNQTFELE